MFDEESQQLRWFVLPSEAAACINGNHSPSTSPLPFCPPGLREELGLPAFEKTLIDTDISENDMKDYNYFAPKVLQHKECDAKENPNHNKVCNLTESYVDGISSVKCVPSDQCKNVSESGNGSFSTGQSPPENYCPDIQQKDSVDLRNCHDVCNPNLAQKESCATNIHSKGKHESTTRKRVGDHTEESKGNEIMTKKVKEAQAIHKTAGGKKKQGLKWYSPPKTVFAPFLKVRCFFDILLFSPSFTTLAKYTTITIQRFWTFCRTKQTNKQQHDTRLL